jgi:quinoprotein dehydrogenase-associated probable ABC transporter substrate-binding protein
MIHLRAFGATAGLARAALLLAFGLTACQGAKADRVLRVCADPNNLPYSNRAEQGFENKIAQLVASDRHEKLEYTWWAQRRGYVRNTLKAGTCDVLIGVPSGFGMADTTRPYYRSSYVFVSRRDRNLHLQSLDDPRLHALKIGVQLIGDDFNNSPPAHALSNRGVVKNVVGYSVYGDYARSNPLQEIVSAVDRGDVDAAVVWGPPAGYFARSAEHALVIAPVMPQMDRPALPFAFDMAMGVRRGDTQLRRELDEVIARRQTDIDRILAEYGVPRVDREANHER